MHRFVPLLLFVVMMSSCATTPERPQASEARISTDSVAVPDGIESGKLEETSIVVAPMQSVEEGVYFFRNGFSTLILDLASGHYRYWFSSDVITGHEPTYPLTGKYVADGVVIRLEHHQPSMQDIWVFRKLNDQTTLWRPTAVKWWHENRSFDSFGILYPTKLKPEDIWGKDVWKKRP